MSRVRILLIENSRDVTGAFVSALALANVLRVMADTRFVLPRYANSRLIKRLKDAEIDFFQLPMVEIGRSINRIFLYLPCLIFNVIYLRYFLNKENYRYLIVNDYYNLIGASLKFFGWSGKVITYVRLLPFHQNTCLNRIWVALAFRYSSKVIAVSYVTFRQLPNRKNLYVIYDPIEAPRSITENLSTKSGRKIKFLYLSNYIEGKGHLIALKAFNQIEPVANGLELRFVGSDMALKKNTELKRSLIELVDALRLGECVSICGPTDTTATEISECDVFLNLSKSESFSRTCLEASALGKPVIATNCGGPSEIIENGVSGFPVKVDDIVAISEAMKILVKNPVLRAEFGINGARISRERFSENRLLEQYIKHILL